MRCTMSGPRPWLILLLASAGLHALAWKTEAQSSRPIRLDATHDVWVSEVGREADGNNGAAPRLKLKAIQEMTLLDVDAAPMRGRTIRSATLHLKKAGDDRLLRVSVSSVGAEWFEGTGSNYAIQPGGATFRHRRHPDLAWSIGGGDLCHVVQANGGTVWRMADASPPDRDGWQVVPVEPAVVAARVAGLSQGFLVFDDTGSEWTRRGESFTFRLFPNRFAYSREQNRASAPYFEVMPGPEDRRPPSSPSGLRVEPQTDLLPAGEALVSWTTPSDAGPAGTLGFFAEFAGRAVPRELIPMAAAPGGRVEMHLRDLGLPPGTSGRLSVRAVDAAGNLGSSATADIRVSDRLPAPLPPPTTESARAAPAANLPRLGSIEVAILDELDKVHPVTGALIPSQPDGYLSSNHIWDAGARRIALRAARNEFVAFQVLLRGEDAAHRERIRPELTFDVPAGRSPRVEFGRYRAVPSKGGPLPDPIVPLGFPADAPAGAKNASLHVEVYVPHDLPAGEYRGTLTLSAGGAGQGALRLPVALRVWNFTLPDHLSFLPEMNCYGLPDNERDYYRLAHRHRTVINRLPYHQGGQVADGCAPRWDARRLAFDWSDWDRRFGPLLDGSAFADLPREGVPVEVFYLPLHENWPSPMEGNYNGSYWADRAFPESYRRAFVAASRGMAEHFRAKGWTETLFQCLLNNKVDYKRRGWSRGSSPWLLDEPASFQDFWALRYFARAFHEGINQAEGSPAAPGRNGSPASSSSWPRMVFRADISRPQWRRDSLDGLVDYHVVGGAVRQYPRLVSDRKRAFGEIVLEYGSTNPIEASNLQPAGWCLDAWSMGTDGIVPWQTVGNAGSWERADELSLFYPARGRKAVDDGPGVIPSVRLKAYRRGQQDVEYLTLWAALQKEPRWAVGRRVREALKLAGTRRGTGITGAEDAGRIDYARLRPQDLWALRVRVGEALSRMHPAPASKVVDFRTPPRDPDHLPPGEVVGGMEAAPRPR